MSMTSRRADAGMMGRGGRDATTLQMHAEERDDTSNRLKDYKYVGVITMKIGCLVNCNREQFNPTI